MKVSELDRLLHMGKGHWGSVSLCQHAPSLRLVACKKIKRSRVTQASQVKRIHREKEVLQKVAAAGGSPHIVELLGVDTDDTCIYFFLEACAGGALHRHLPRVPEGAARAIGAAVAAALAFLDGEGIVHRDVKASNVLLHGDGRRALLGDFGYARELPDGETASTYCGTPHAMAPEMSARRGHDRRVDLWSFGILLYELAWGAPPFGYAAREAQPADGPASLPEHPGDATLGDVKDLVGALLHVDPRARPTWAAVRAHDALAGVVEGAPLGLGEEKRRTAPPRDVDVDAIFAGF